MRAVRGVTSPLAAAADVTAELAFIANKLPINGGGLAERIVVCSVHSSPSQTVVFAVWWILLSAKYTFVLFYIVNRGQLEFWECVLMLPGALSS